MPAAFVTTPFEFATGTNSTVSKARAVSVTAGNLLFAITWQYSASNTCSTVTDTQGNTWVSALGPIRGSTSGADPCIYVWYAANAKAGATTATATWSGSAKIGILIGEVSGLANGGALDQAFGQAQSPTTDLTVTPGTSSTLAQAIEAAVAFAIMATNKTANNWTADAAPNSNNFEFAQRLITASTGAVSPTWTTASNTHAASVAVFFKDGVPDTTPPTLTSAAATGGTLICAGSVSTNEANGTLYAVFTGSATAPTGTQVEAGQDNTGAAALRAASQSVSTTSTQTIASGSITAGTRYMHAMHKDAAGNRSTVVSSASFAVTAPPDTTPPTMTGTVTVTPSATSASALCPTASDNVAVTAYEASIDGGSTWPFTSATSTISITGLTASTAYTGRFRAKDAAGNVSTPVLVQGFTTIAGPATATTLTGPGGGLVGIASAAIAVGFNGTISGSVVVNLSDGGGGGTLSASSVTLTAGSPTATVTYTPGSAGSKTLTASSSGLTSSTLSYTASTTVATVTIPGLAAWSGTLQAALTVPNVVVVQRSSRAQVLALTNQTTNGAGDLAITSGSLVAGIGYMVLGFTDDGTSSFRRAVTAT